VAFFGGHPPDSARGRRVLKTTPARERLLTREQAARRGAELRAGGKVVVFTNGVFDLLHPGHVRYLRQARGLGDALIVGVNADESVRRNKGPSRPLNPEHERAEVLAALASVDAVVLFPEETPAEIIAALQPDILVKGADWAADRIVGRDIVEARGGRVERIAVEQGHSTTAILERIRRVTGEPAK
jgi:D-beta-D-heptose 7-phosphate kinase/D-beta-D-heptose 1-phosphate adenosyltransferase